MIVDSSALLAIVLREAGATTRLELALGVRPSHDRRRRTDSRRDRQSILHSRIGALSRSRLLDPRCWHDSRRGVSPVRGTAHWPESPSEPLPASGAGRHPAALNFGDCLTYATAKVANRPLLCLGDDFVHTDLALAEPHPRAATLTRCASSGPPTCTRRRETSRARNRGDRRFGVCRKPVPDLLGATGTGKTATMAWTIEKLQRPALVIAHNKTLAAQLCSEFREFFPQNAVEYFVSYYDYYQPEAYVPQADLYIEKDSSRTTTSSACGTPRPRRCSPGATSWSSPGSRASTASARPRSSASACSSSRRGRSTTATTSSGSWSTPVRPKRHRARPRPLPGAGRRRRGPAGEHRDRVPHLVLRRRGRADHPVRPAHGRGIRELDNSYLAGDRVRRPPSRRSSARSTRSGPSSRSRLRASRRKAACSRPTASGSAPSTTSR